MKRILFLTALILAGCSTMPLRSALHLSTVDPMSADPAQWAAKVDLPDGIAVRENGATLSITANHAPTGDQINESFALVETADVWTLAEKDAAALRGIQTQIRNWKTQDPKSTKGSISVNVTGCITIPEKTPQGVVHVDLSTDGGERFWPLVKDMPLADILSHAPSVAPATCPERA